MNNDNNDCRLCLILSKLFIPGYESDKYVIDINYNGDNNRVKYPMAEPLVISLKNIFTQDKNVINLTIMIQQNQKYRKIAKGEINIYRKYILSEKLEIEKFVHLELYRTQIDKQILGSTIINAVSSMGKIYIKACLIDPELESSKIIQKGKQDSFSIFSKTSNIKHTQLLRSNIKQYNLNKDKVGNVRTERFKSLAMKENEYLQSIVKEEKNNNKKSSTNKLLKKENNEEDSLEDIPLEEKPYNDGLSDVSVTVIEGLEDDCVKIEEINSEMNEFVSKVKIMFDEKFDQILPSNNEELKLFVNKIAKQIQLIAENYISNLEQLQEINQKIKQQARIYYEKYKERKREFKRERKELKRRNQQLEEEINDNIEENKQVKGKFDDFKSELSYFKSLIGFKDENVKMDEDILSMVKILNSVKYDIDITAGLNDNQVYALNQILQKYSEKNNLDDDKLLSSSVIIDKIEDIVNTLFKQSKIRSIEIKQNTEIEYEFNNLVVILRLDHDTLIVEKEEISLEDWLLEHFSTNSDDPISKKKELAEANKKSLNQLNSKKKTTGK